MAELPPDSADRRDLSGVLTSLQVGVAEIKTTQQLQTKTLERMEARLDVSVLRDEFKARNLEVDVHLDKIDRALKSLEDNYHEQRGSSQTWRLIFSGALALLTVVVAAVGALRL